MLDRGSSCSIQRWPYAITERYVGDLQSCTAVFPDEDLHSRITLVQESHVQEYHVQE